MEKAENFSFPTVRYERQVLGSRTESSFLKIHPRAEVQLEVILLFRGRLNIFLTFRPQQKFHLFGIYSYYLDATIDPSP